MSILQSARPAEPGILLQDDMTIRDGKRRSLGRWVRAIISIALIVLVFVNLDTDELGRYLKNVSFAAILALVAIDLALRILSAFRWQVLYRSTNPSSAFAEIVRITFVSSFLGQAMPGVIGVEALRIYSLAKSKTDFPGAFASVIADRMFGLMSLGLVILLGMLIGPGELRELMLIPVLLTLALLAAIIVAVAWPVSRHFLESAFPSAFILKIRTWIDKVYHCFDAYRARPRLIVWSLVLSVLFQLGRVALFYAAALLIGESPDFVYFLAIVPVVMFASLMPISISGLGVREASLVLLFTQFHVMGSAPSFTVALLVFVSGLLSTLPGGWFYARQRQQVDELIKHSNESSGAAS
ncbi:MAG TPA: lysylphosphatidylglycerol synthase transmembrane domain-containing protein [Woeseiaceae bacterium]|nr:lysylphosphatidylglycerol synthase transmembrane domain-containing protein [Woeseiaceae bacterium]